MSDLATHPAFQHERHVVPLSGFSGAYVALLEGSVSERKRVRKAAVLPKDNARLQEQAILQGRVATALSGTAHVPAMLEEGFVEGCYWFDMEFVPGLDAVEYLSTATPARAQSFIKQVSAILRVQAGAIDPHGPLIDLAAQVNGKLDEIDAKTKDAFKDLTVPLRQSLGQDQILLEPNFAHGDLTLENILVDQHENLWLIDTIPSPFNHYWIDLAKLYQDLEGRWFLHRGRSLSIGLTRMISEHLMQEAIRLDPRYKAYHPTLLGLTFARILPYCKSAEDTAFVTSRIKLALQIAARNQELAQ